MMSHDSGSFQDYDVSGAKYEGYYVASNKNASLIFLVHDW